jgi:hypothetical protein
MSAYDELAAAREAYFLALHRAEGEAYRARDAMTAEPWTPDKEGRYPAAYQRCLAIRHEQEFAVWVHRMFLEAKR